MKKIITLIDPGLHGRAGHHFDLIFGLSRALSMRGYSIRVFANERCDRFVMDKLAGHAEVRATLKTNPYMNQRFMGEEFYMRYQSSLVARDLGRIPRSDLFVFPNLFLEQFIALSSVSRKQAVMGVFHLPVNWPVDTLRTMWQRAFRSTPRTDSDTKIGVFERELLLDYESVLQKDGLNISKLPVPFDGYKRTRAPGSLTRVAVLGHQRQYKNESLRELVPAILDAGFELIMQDSSESIKFVDRYDDRLKVVGYVEDLSDLINEADAVILPYEKQWYRLNGSGIAWKAVACGVPMIGPGGTSISGLIRTYANGAVFHGTSARDMVGALQRVAADYRRVAAAAELARVEWSRSNSLERFVDEVEEFCLRGGVAG